MVGVRSSQATRSVPCKYWGGAEQGRVIGPGEAVPFTFGTMMGLDP